MALTPRPDRNAPMRLPITALLQSTGEDDQDGLSTVLSLVYDRLQQLAGAAMYDQQRDDVLQTTMLANETVVRLLAARPEFNDRTHLLATASQIMRQILVDHARARKRLKRGGGRRPVPLDAAVVAFEERSGDLAAVNEAIERLAGLDGRLARLVELRFFLGLTMDESAVVLDLSTRTAEREWATARAWLQRELTRDA